MNDIFGEKPLYYEIAERLFHGFSNLNLLILKKKNKFHTNKRSFKRKII